MNKRFLLIVWRQILGLDNALPLDAANTSVDAHLEWWQPQFARLSQVTAVFADWHDNAAIANWRAEDAVKYGLPLAAGAALADYTSAAKTLPEWADHQKIALAEKNFVDSGALSVTLLFCASLPECYVVPDLSAVLHATGQLENHAEHRIRATGAMVFPVMMPGGLTNPNGGGIAQIFKVRLIHATIRHLILRGAPQQAINAWQTAQTSNATHQIAPLAAITPTDSMYRALLVRGWDIGHLGLPCNQVELAYTLLTFSYIYLRGLKTLSVCQTSAEEVAYLHAWNVAGHFLGISPQLMAHDMQSAKTLFDRIQTEGRRLQKETPVLPDPRPALGEALIKAMTTVIPLGIIKPFPNLLTRKLCGKEVSRELGLMAPQPWLSTLLFMLVFGIARVVDRLVRIVMPRFSLSRLLTRVIGYPVIMRFMMDQTRPLRLPSTLHGQIQGTISQWGNDVHAPSWVNWLEDLLTQHGEWQHRVSPDKP
jgi:ER-bound oxygenase mpaB/B'/Rubber oxygenase, catalytic domain